MHWLGTFDSLAKENEDRGQSDCACGRGDSLADETPLRDNFSHFNLLHTQLPVSNHLSSTMRPDGPRPSIIGPDSGPEAPFPLRMKGKVVSGFGRGSKEVRCPLAALSLPFLPMIPPFRGYRADDKTFTAGHPYCKHTSGRCLLD